MLETVDVIKQRINQINTQMKVYSKILREHNKGIIEDSLFYKIKPIPLNFSVGAVDSGFVLKSFSGIDVFVCKTAGVIFKYTNNILTKYSYEPKMPKPRYEVLESMADSDAFFYPSVRRLLEEIILASKLAEKVDVLLLDGSIVPLVKDIPYNPSSEVMLIYKKLINAYKRLYTIVKKRNVLLFGIVKDTRSNRFIKSIKQVQLSSSDISLLNHVLYEGERTSVFDYSSHDKEHPVLKELGRFLVFYLRVSKYDSVIRVEFPAYYTEYDKLASIIFSLSNINKAYAYPSVLLEADMKAKLIPIDLYFESYFKKSLRRSDARPFR